MTRDYIHGWRVWVRPYCSYRFACHQMQVRDALESSYRWVREVR